LAVVIERGAGVPGERILVDGHPEAREELPEAAVVGASEGAVVLLAEDIDVRVKDVVYVVEPGSSGRS
jgi:hypothetical protein